jgi:hypothetical protein
VNSCIGCAGNSAGILIVVHSCSKPLSINAGVSIFPEMEGYVRFSWAELTM